MFWNPGTLSETGNHGNHGNICGGAGAGWNEDGQKPSGHSWFKFATNIEPWNEPPKKFLNGGRGGGTVELGNHQGDWVGY